MALLSLLAVSCSQYHIFYAIANETAPRKPRIEGAPTNMVVFERKYPDRNDLVVPIMYVASGQIHWYAKAQDADKPQWDLTEYDIPQPTTEGKIIALAVAGDRLYALCHDDRNSVNATLRFIEADGYTWKTISSEAADYPVIQSIYVDPSTEQLFAGAGSKNDQDQVLATYAILYLDNKTNTLKLLKGDTSIFSGVAYRDNIYYLSTRGYKPRDSEGIGGIFQVSENGNVLDPASVIPLDDNTDAENNNNYRMFMSMIRLEDEDNTIIAVERDGGGLYKVQSGSFERMRYTNNEWIAIGKYATEAIALWENSEENSAGSIEPLVKTLVVGIQEVLNPTANSSHTYGYVEFDLNPQNGSFNTGTNRRDPSKQLPSVNNQEQYTGSLGKRPINHLFQAPRKIDEDMTFFASTQTAGLWSYRDRSGNGGWEWNAEE